MTTRVNQLTLGVVSRSRNENEFRLLGGVGHAASGEEVLLHRPRRF